MDSIRQSRRELLLGFAMAPIVAAAPATAASPGANSAPRNAVLPAKPAPLTIDLAQAAIIVVDMQNDFGSPGGMFALSGIDISGIQKVVAPIARVLESARGAGVKVVYLKMAFRPDLSDIGPPGCVNRTRHLEMGVGKNVKAPDGKDSRVLIRDTWNTDIVDALKPHPEDVVIYKHRFSGFYETDLHDILQRSGIRALVFTGCTTSVCVDSTVRDAMFRDYLPVLLADCMNEPIGHALPRNNQEATLLTTEVLLGWVTTSTDFVATLSSKASQDKS